MVIKWSMGERWTLTSDSKSKKSKLSVALFQMKWTYSFTRTFLKRFCVLKLNGLNFRKMQKWIVKGWKGCCTCKESMQTPGVWHGKELRRWRVKLLCPLCSCSFVQCEKLIGEISKAITTFNWANSSGAVRAVSRGTLLNVHFFFTLSHMLLLILQISSLSHWHMTLRLRCRQLGLDYYLRLYVSCRQAILVPHHLSCSFLFEGLYIVGFFINELICFV